MRHLILIFLLCILTQTAYAQFRSGKVVYKVIPPKSIIEFRDTTKIRTEAGKRATVLAYNKLRVNASNLSLIMTFNTKEAVAKMPSTMEVGNHSDLHSAAIKAGFHRKYYTKIEESFQLHDFEIAGREWLVRYDRDISTWEITNETKVIHGYTCYKATTPIKINGEEIDENLEAWFTPEIPFRYGPMEIYGLPGMILEVRQRNFTFYAAEIKLSKTDISINEPKGKVIPYTEYIDNMMGMRDAFKQ